MGCGTSAPVGLQKEEPTTFDPVTNGTSLTVPEDGPPADAKAKKGEAEAATKEPEATGNTGDVPDQEGPVKPVGPQEGRLQDLLATRLAKKPGQLLSIQDASESLQDRLLSNSTRRGSTLGVTFDTYAEMHHKEFTELLELDRHKGWALKKKDEALGVEIFTRYDNKRGVMCFKGVTRMRLSTEDGLFYLLENLLDASKRPEWDEMCMKGEIVEQFLPYYRISYFQMASPVQGVIMDRDVLLMGRFRFEEDGTLLVPLVSTLHDQKPEIPDFVRLNFLCGGYILRKTDDKCVYEVSFMGAVDPMGWVPGFIKNLAAWKQAQVLAKFKSTYKL